MKTMFWGNGREALMIRLEAMLRSCVVPAVIGKIKPIKVENGGNVEEEKEKEKDKPKKEQQRKKPPPGTISKK